MLIINKIKRNSQQTKTNKNPNLHINIKIQTTKLKTNLLKKTINKLILIK